MLYYGHTQAFEGRVKLEWLDLSRCARNAAVRPAVIVIVKVIVIVIVIVMIMIIIVIVIVLVLVLVIVTEIVTAIVIVRPQPLGAQRGGPPQSSESILHNIIV